MELHEFMPTSDNIKRKSLKFGNQKINLHENLKPFKPHALNPIPGSMDICFVSKKSIGEWINGLKDLHIKIEEGPVLKTGANGPIKSIYIRDPDNNLIEISNEI
jgi:catechol 2,3-dioxygenase-like lactoylglutathione lyase family enzyme